MWATPSRTSDASARHLMRPWALLALTGVLLAGGALFVSGVVRPQVEERAEASWRSWLETSADRRAGLIDAWLSRGLAAAGQIARQPTVRWLHGATDANAPFPAREGAVRRVRELLADSVKLRSLRSAWVVGADGSSVSSGADEDEAAARGAARRALEGQRPLVDVFDRGTDSLLIAYAAPIPAPRKAAVVLLATPASELHGLLADGPARAASWRCFLAARVGDPAAVIEPTGPREPAAARRATGSVGFLARTSSAIDVGSGLAADAREPALITATRPLRAAPWRLVVTVDREEALEPARARLRDRFFLGVLVLVALLAVGTAVALRRRSRLELSLASREAQLAALLEHANDAILLVDRSGRIRSAHGGAPSLYGRGVEQLAGVELVELRAPAARARAPEDYEALFANGQLVYETEHLGAGGEVIPVEVSARSVRVGEETLMLAIVRDVRHQRTEERRVRALNRALRTLAAVDRLVLHERDPEVLLPGACRAAVRDGGFALAWIGLLEAGRLVVRASAGGEQDLLRRLVEEESEDAPWWRALREGRTVVRRAGSSAGGDEDGAWMGSLSLTQAIAAPLRSGGEPRGVLVLFAGCEAESGIELLPLAEDLAVNLSLALEAARARRDRVEAEDEMRRARERYRVALLHSPVVVFEQDAELRYSWVHDPEGRLIGEAVGRTDSDLFSHGDTRRLTNLKTRVLETGRGLRELVELSVGGNAAAFDLTLEPLRSREGVVTGVIGTGVDVTASRAREARLRQLSRAIEQSPSAVMITDTRGAIEYVNPAFASITGYAADEVLGRNPRLLKSGQQPPELYDELWNTITAGREWQGELCNRRKNGELYWEAASISPLLDDEGRLTHFLAVLQDLTARREAERELEDARLKLLQSQKLEAVGRLAGGVAHDFNNLLNVIMGFTELLARGLQDDPQAQRRVDQIMRAARRAGDLTHQLLAFSRRQVLQPQVVDLPLIVRDFERMLERLIGEDVELSILSGDGPILVKVDPGQLEQVLMNLCVNARDAMPRGGELTISATRVSLDRTYAASHGRVEPGDYAMLAVTDTGVGMDAATQAQVFEPFFTTKPSGKGTGLGLSTVYGIVKQSGGYVWVYSEVGQGTTLKVYLPLTEEKESEPAPEEAPAPTASQGTTVLVVEDQDSLREMIRELLEELGYEVEEADGGGAALELAARREQPLDLLLTDLVMPRMSGTDLARELRKGWPGLRVLYMSGYTPEVVARHGTLEPGVQILNKPFSSAELARRVKAALEAPPRPH